MTIALRAAAAALFVTGTAAIAGAQAAGSAGVEVLGVRAQGMAGAFVAVADDATAVYWNPAGLGTGAFLSLAAERTHVSLPADPSGATPVLRTGAILAGTPPLGAGYYRLGGTHVVPVALVQSIGDHLNVGGAVKGVWGEGVDGRTHGRVDVDLGVMVRTDAWRIGLVARNLTEPRFGPEVVAFEASRYQLARHVRVGAALFPRDGLTIAADADLTTLDTPDGRRRALALGVEQEAGMRVVLRGGVRAQTVDDARPSISGGGSVAVYGSIWLDAQATGGADRADRSWTVGLRFHF